MRFALLFPAIMFLVQPGVARAGFFDDLLQGAGQALQQGSLAPAGLSQTDIVAGLKQALETGTRRTVKQVGQRNGYWRDDRIRIPLPEKWRKPARLLERAGFGSYADELQRRMNRAAETAAPLAKPIFLKAIRGMRIADVQRIWKGPEDAATRYFKAKTETDLIRAFTPLVHRELERSGAVRSWRKFSGRYSRLPLIGGYLKDDLDNYATRMAIEGMFVALADEEAKIRHDPAARTTELLRRVFR